MKGVEHMIWPYDDRGRLVGEDVWEVDESKHEVIKLDEAEVLTPQESGRLLEPFIKPLPAFDSFVSRAGALSRGAPRQRR